MHGSFNDFISPVSYTHERASRIFFITSFRGECASPVAARAVRKRRRGGSGGRRYLRHFSEMATMRARFRVVARQFHSALPPPPRSSPEYSMHDLPTCPLTNCREEEGSSVITLLMSRATYEAFLAQKRRSRFSEWLVAHRHFCCSKGLDEPSIQKSINT